MQIDRANIDRILVSRLRFLGDVILTTPVIAALREAFPEAGLAYLTNEAYSPVLEHNPNLDEIIPLKARQSVPRVVRFYESLRRRRFDLVVDLFGNPRSAVLTRLTGARYRVGGDYRLRGKLYNIRVPQPAGRKLDAVSFHLQSLEALGLQYRTLSPAVYLTSQEREHARQGLEVRFDIDFHNPVIGLHPGATWPNKHWPVTYFARVANQLETQGVRVLITQGPGEYRLVRQLQQLAPRAIILPLMPIREVAAVLSQLNAYVANDCGVMHLAAAAGTPTIGLFGPSEPQIWFPYDRGAGHQALWFEIECRPCHQNECPLGHLDCQYRLNPESIIEAVLRLCR